MRLDKFLKVSRLIKRRTVANSICESARVFVNDNPAKPAKVIKEGDIFGAADDMIKPNTKDVLVQADKMTGMPKLARNVRGNFFRTAAR